MSKDLRTHLAALKVSPSEFYLEVKKLLSAKYELSAVLMQLEQMKKFGEDIDVELQFVNDIPRTKAGKYRWLIQKLDVEFGDWICQNK